MLVAPDVFAQSEETGTVTLLRVTVAGADLDAARDAESLCPVGAITVLEQ